MAAAVLEELSETHVVEETWINMLNTNRKNIERHIKTHSEHSAEDQAAVSILKTFLRSNGKINTNFRVVINGQIQMEHLSLSRIPVFQGDRNRIFLFRLKEPISTVKKMGKSNIH